MVDVAGKPETERLAVASAEVLMTRETLELVEKATAARGKGDVLAVARVAGIMAARRTSELIPLCHPVRLTSCDVDLEVDRKLPGVRIRAAARAIDRTGVEMEALVAASTAALTVYDMVKAAERGVEIRAVRLEEKRGGRSGVWRRGDDT
jgi:cyclic pyranopterin phosphate synthase